MGNTFRDIVRPPLVGYEMQSLATPVAAVTSGARRLLPVCPRSMHIRWIPEDLGRAVQDSSAIGTLAAALELFAANMTHRQWVGFEWLQRAEAGESAERPDYRSFGKNAADTAQARNREGLNRHRLVPPSMVKLAFPVNPTTCFAVG